MTQITEALEAARAHILDAYRIWQADDVSAVPPPKSGAGSVIAKIDAVLSTLPIAVEGKVEELEDLRLAAASIREWMPETLPADEQGKVHFARALAESAAEAIEKYLSALISSPGKDGGQEVEAVAHADVRETIAKIIDPHCFLPVKGGNDEVDDLIVTMVQQDKDSAFLKADRILALGGEPVAYAFMDKVGVIGVSLEKSRLHNSPLYTHPQAAELERLKVDASNHAADAETVRRERDALQAELERLRQPASTALVERLTKALSAVNTWAEQRCPCRNEEPNPCPLCGADANKSGDICLSAENTFPRDLLTLIRGALSSASKEGHNANS